MLHLSPNAGLAVFLQAHPVLRAALGELGHVTGSLGDVPLQVSVHPALRTPIARIDPHLGFLSAQQSGHLLQVGFAAALSHQTNEDRWYQQFMRDAIALRRNGTPEGISGVAAFLCSEDARYMTGQGRWWLADSAVLAADLQYQSRRSLKTPLTTIAQYAISPLLAQNATPRRQPGSNANALTPSSFLFIHNRQNRPL